MHASADTEPAPPRGRLRFRFRRWLREPLVHFLVLGAALFVVSRAVKPATDRTGPSRQIVLSLDDLRQLQIGFAAQWQRPPKGEELYALIENRIEFSMA